MANHPPAGRVLKRPANHRPTQLQQCVDAGVIKKARRPMALFVHDYCKTHPLVISSRKAASARLVDAAKAWRALPSSGKDEYVKRSQAEFQEQRAARMCNGIGMARPSSPQRPMPIPTHTGIQITCGRFSWRADEASFLGQGGFSVVYRGVETQSQIGIAVKTYNSTGGGDAEAECAIYAQIKDVMPPSPFLSCFGTTGGDTIGMMVLVLEFVGDGDLGHYVRANGTHDQLYQDVARQVGVALHLLHSRKIVHLDVKPYNVLLRMAERRVFLSDFGMAHVFPVRRARYNQFCTPQYRPPELWWWGH